MTVSAGYFVTALVTRLLVYQAQKTRVPVMRLRRLVIVGHDQGAAFLAPILRAIISDVAYGILPIICIWCLLLVNESRHMWRSRSRNIPSIITNSPAICLSSPSRWPPDCPGEVTTSRARSTASAIWPMPGYRRHRATAPEITPMINMTVTTVHILDVQSPKGCLAFCPNWISKGRYTPEREVGGRAGCCYNPGFLSHAYARGFPVAVSLLFVDSLRCLCHECLFAANSFTSILAIAFTFSLSSRFLSSASFSRKRPTSLSYQPDFP